MKTIDNYVCVVMLKFSLLVPVYNGEKYLPNLFESFLRQDIPIDEYEIVCVDDCSSDDSIGMIKSYQKHYPNIRLLRNEKNSRLATNVNKLVDFAEGKYFWLIGQDDYIESNCLGMLWEKLEKKQLEVLLFNYDKVDEKGILLNEYRVFGAVEKTSGLNYIKGQFSDRDYCSYILGYEWRGVYKTDFWKNNGIRCVDGMNYEDTVILLKALVYANAVASINEILYHYRVNSGSITYTENFKKKGELIYEFAFDVGEEVEEFYNKFFIIDQPLANNLLQHLKRRYNNFTFDLIRTPKEYKKDFYKKVSENQSFVNSKKKWLQTDAKLLLLPHLGYPISRICESAYRMKKKLLK